MNNKDMFVVALVLEMAGHELTHLDLDEFVRRLDELEKMGESEAPLTLAVTREHLNHMRRLAEACRPIQEEMARAPKPNGGMMHGNHTLVA